MKNTFGNNLTVTIFGESHGSALGIVIDGIAPGIPVDREVIDGYLARRRPSSSTDTARREKDEYEILSGVFNGKTTGTALAIVIPNTDTRSGDYEYGPARPSHADYSAYCKYHGYEDYRGGGHFSGRITAALAAAGGILLPALEAKGIRIGTHIMYCGSARDVTFNEAVKAGRFAGTAENVTKADPGEADIDAGTGRCTADGCSESGTGAGMDTVAAAGLSEESDAACHAGTGADPDAALKAAIGSLQKKMFPVIDDAAAERIAAQIMDAGRRNDSIGGITETAITGIPAGVGEPWFDSVEGMISHAIFSIGAIKGIEFGDGWDMASGMHGSEANDAMRVADGRVRTVTNHNGGINGGITNGMPVIFKCAVKPTPSIAQPQKTINFLTGEDTELLIRGRHDPAIIRRICPVIDSVTAIAVADMMTGRYGTDWLAE